MVLIYGVFLEDIQRKYKFLNLGTRLALKPIFHLKGGGGVQ